MRQLRVTIVRLAAGLALLACGVPVRAEITNVRVGGIYGLVNLPVYVVEDRHLIEAHAAAAGMPGVTVTSTQVSGGATAADLLLSGNVDVSSVGATNMMVLWDRTRAMHAQQARGMMALCDSPVSLITVDPRIKSLRDFTDADRIAVTSIKVSVQAMVLQMAVAKEFGWDERTKLDQLMVMMPHEDGMAALLSGGAEVKTQAAQLPFSVEELQSGKAHLEVDPIGVTSLPPCMPCSRSNAASAALRLRRSRYPACRRDVLPNGRHASLLKPYPPASGPAARIALARSLSIAATARAD
jgi:NitT/TauT family transport system substrate-binding protein